MSAEHTWQNTKAPGELCHLSRKEQQANILNFSCMHLWSESGDENNSAQRVRPFPSSGSGAKGTSTFDNVIWICGNSQFLSHQHFMVEMLLDDLPMNPLFYVTKSRVDEASLVAVEACRTNKASSEWERIFKRDQRTKVRVYIKRASVWLKGYGPGKEPKG